MKQNILAALSLTTLALAGCDRAKPRHLPPDPFAAPRAEAPPTAGLSAGLHKRAEPAGFFLDHIGRAVDPFNRPRAVTAAGVATLLDGFGFDAVTRAPGKGVDVVIDGKAYGTRYGLARADVANYFKTPALAATGFRTTLPAGTLAPGPHTVRVRVVATDGKGYFDSPSVGFEVR